MNTMKTPETPINEPLRIDALKEYSILDTLPEKEYDEITYLASFICDTPISLISLIDEKRQWFKSHFGLNATETPREVAFCAHAINNIHEIFIVPDSRNDDRFFDNPLVTNDPHVIFYAGVPLISENGLALGTLCIIDHKPKELNENQKKALQYLANQVSRLFEKRKQSVYLEMTNNELEFKNLNLQNFARNASHDIKSPLYSITMLTDLLLEEYSSDISQHGLEIISHIKSSSNKLAQLIDGILKYSKDSSIIVKEKETINFTELINFIKEILDPQNLSLINVNYSPNEYLFTNKTALEQILINLISNSIKYNDKDKTIINVSLNQDQSNTIITIEDNGIGVKEEDKERIFEIFQTTSNTDKKGMQGTGIGLATVKSLVKILNGRIEVFSEFGKGMKTILYFKK